MTEQSISKDAIVIERTFDAPAELIWKLWTDSEALKNWYGPEGFAISVANLDFRLGGKRLVCMENGNMKIWTTGEFTEIVPKQRLAYTDSPSDENGNKLSATGTEVKAGEEPLITIVTVVLEELDGRTKMLVTHAGLPANEEGASAGWEQAINKLASLMESLQKAK
jgi:uncharacterized protein YndB with AHSA1/START domain